MNRFITIVFCLALIMAAPAQAQQREYKSGLNYTTFSKPKAVPANGAQAKPAEKAETAKKTQTSQGTPEASADPATRIWNKYKELATGTTPEQKAQKEQNDKPAAPEKPDAPAKPDVKSTKQTKAETQPNNAFGAILENWKNAKENRRDMRSMSFNNPEPPAKPSAEKPEAP